MPTKFQKAFAHLKLGRFDRYILEEVVGVFIGSCVFIIFILLMFQALRLAEFFIVHGASGMLLLKMALFMSISFLPAALPLAFLISVLISFGRLSADSEIIAMKSSGVSLQRLSLPVWLFSILIVTITVTLNLKWVPWAEISAKQTELTIGNTRAVMAIKEGTFTSGFFNLLLFADKVDAQKNRLHHVFIFDEREAKNPLTYIANEAEIVQVKTDDLGAAIMLRLYNGSMHHSDLDTHTYEKMDFKSYHLYLKMDGGTHGTVIQLRMIPHNELVKKIESTPVTEFDGRELRGEYWRRLSTAFSPLIFVLLGIGFGVTRNRTAKMGAILTGFIILVIYWLLQTFGFGVIHRGVPAFVALQMPNLTMLLLGIFGFWRAIW